MFSMRMSRLALLTALSALVVMAQTGSGTVQGVVKDSSSAIIPGATVSLVHTDTNRKYETTSNDVGFFGFPPTLPGSYEISVAAPGMQTWTGKFLLVVGQTAVVNPVMAVGALATEVTVSAGVTPLVTTTDATLSRNLERTRIEQLPINGRNIAQLALNNTPGLVGGQDGAMNPIVNGLRDGVELYHDGAVIKNRDTGNFAGRLPGMDAIEELRVETSLSSAKFDRPGSIILSTKSGSNRVRGSLFETNRNSAIGVARRRQDFYSKPPQYNRNEFGGSVGGPVYLPKIYDGRNKTFFFTSLEFQRVAQSSTTQTTVPTMAMREGDYSGLVDSLNRKTTIYDPFSTGPAPTWQRIPFPDNRIPAGMTSPVAKYIYSIMPAPTRGDNPVISNNYFGLGFNRTNDWMWTTRIDQRLSDRDQIFGRVSYNKNTVKYSNGVPATNEAMNVVYGTHDNVSGVSTWTHSFSPTFLGETMVSFSREDKFVGSPRADGITNVADFLKMPNPGNDPYVAYQSYSAGFGLNYSVQQMRQNFTNILVVDQNFTKYMGAHEIRFGGKLRHEYLKVQIDGPGSGSWYSGQFTAQFDPSSGSSYGSVPFTGHNAAAFHIGAVSQYQLTVKRPPYNLRDRAYAGYIQDNWKVTPALTLTLGLRYENLPAMKEKDYFMASFNKASGNLVLGRSLEEMYAAKQTTPAAIAAFQKIGVTFESREDAGLPKALVNGNPWLFSPRLGFAYRVGDKRPLVLRGGYGLYNSQVALRVWDNTQGSLVPFGYPIQYQVNDTSIVGDGLPNWALRSAPEYVAGISSRDVLSNANFVRINRGIGIEYTDSEQPPSLAHEWNVSLSREIFGGVVATASYVGTHGVNLPQKYNFNAAPNDFIWYTRTGLRKPTGTYGSVGTNPYNSTTYGTINRFQRTGYSNSNAFQFEAQRRFSAGVGFQFIYEATNAFTNSTFVGNGGGPTIVPATTYLPGAVPEDFDALNRFLYYNRDTAIPKHQLRWNWVVDLPFGKGKPVFRGAGKALNTIVGGWQLAGTGSYRSRWWSLPTNNWGPRDNDIEYYGTKYPIENCTGGTCIPGYLAWNGYISPPLINRTDAAGKCTGICGIPADYKPADQPLIPYGETALAPNAPAGTNMSQYWETSNVWVKLKDGSVVRTSYNTNFHPWRSQYQPGPWTFGLDASLFKNIALTEGVNLRFNADFFNVLNNPGMGTPGGNGIISLQNSSNAPRLLQLTLRLTW